MIKIPKTVLIFALGFVILTAPVIAYYLSPIDAKAQPQVLVVKRREGIKEIASKLKDDGLIKSPSIFVVYSVLAGSAHRFKPGNYKLSGAMSLPSIAASLKTGPPEDISILIKEGDTLSDIEKKLTDARVSMDGGLRKYQVNKAFLTEKVFGPDLAFSFKNKKITSLEGFLFPDTYRFFFNSSVDDVVEKFADNFHAKAVPILKAARDPYKALIIASILEKEIPLADDRSLVAGILYKRLEIGMPLQVDSYPWTYDHYGVPDKPIADPGLDAIKAAVYPKSSEYLYYLSDPATQKTIFSKTFEEHKENKWLYLKR